MQRIFFLVEQKYWNQVTFSPAFKTVREFLRIRWQEGYMNQIFLLQDILISIFGDFVKNFI